MAGEKKRSAFDWPCERGNRAGKLFSPLIRAAAMESELNKLSNHRQFSLPEIAVMSQHFNVPAALNVFYKRGPWIEGGNGGIIVTGEVATHFFATVFTSDGSKTSMLLLRREISEGETLKCLMPPNVLETLKIRTLNQRHFVQCPVL